MLVAAIEDYVQWNKSMETRGGRPRSIHYTQTLSDFLIFAINRDMIWKDLFTLDTLKDFQKCSRFKRASHALIALSGYLFGQGRIDQPLEIPRPKTYLPDIYEQYLLYHKQSQQVTDHHLGQVRRILGIFHDYLQRHQIEFSVLKIEHLDAFIGQFKVAVATRSLYSYYLKGFLKYLYHQRRIIKKDLASLLVSPPRFDRDKPPKFLRPQEVQKLFASLDLSTSTGIRTYAMMYIAYTLGLRPIEISRLTLDDISFQKGELTLPERKGNNPITLPIAEQTIKAIALYLKKGRPKSPHRHLFLTSHLPFRPIGSHTVSYYISKIMKQAGLNSSPYWLRHTYAQNLLHIGQSIYEIKEMMGHQNIHSTERYLHIHTELMRKVLFDEEL